LVGKPDGKRPTEERGVNGGGGQIGWGCGLDSTGSGWGLVAGFCDCGDELSGSSTTGLVIVGKVHEWYSYNTRYFVYRLPQYLLVYISVAIGSKYRRKRKRNSGVACNLSTDVLMVV
jgi:hypothetical protein